MYTRPSLLALTVVTGLDGPDAGWDRPLGSCTALFGHLLGALSGEPPCSALRCTVVGLKVVAPEGAGATRMTARIGRPTNTISLMKATAGRYELQYERSWKRDGRNGVTTLTSNVSTQF